MKFIHLSTFYDFYWKRFYSQIPGLAKQEYKAQYEALVYDCFGWSDFWKQALQPLGYDVEEIFANIQPLQASWAKEEGVAFKKNWMLEVASQQILSFQPTILFIDDHLAFPVEWIEEIKDSCPSIRMTIGWCGSPYNDVHIFKPYDIVLSCIPEIVNQLSDNGHHSEHINHAFESRILSRIANSNSPEINFSFIGQIARGNKFHLQREEVLEKISKEVEIQIYSPSALFSWEEKLKTIIKKISYDSIQLAKKLGFSEKHLAAVPKVGKYAYFSEKPMVKVSPQLKPLLKLPVFGLEMFQILKKSKITFNNHINISNNSASNMRLFEATGVGSCLITDWKDNLHTLFEPDVEVVTYKSANECVDKVKWLLENPEKCSEIALAGHKRTIKDHTFSDRASRLSEIITMELSK